MQPCYKWWEIPYYWLGLKVRSPDCGACSPCASLAGERSVPCLSQPSLLSSS